MSTPTQETWRSRHYQMHRLNNVGVTVVGDNEVHEREVRLDTVVLPGIKSATVTKVIVDGVEWTRPDPTPAYVTACSERLLSLPLLALTRQCPECEEEVTIDDAEHQVITAYGVAYAVVGCGGYWIIDPKLVGIDNPRWTPWDEGARS